LKLQYDETLSNFAFNFNLRRYNVVSNAEAVAMIKDTVKVGRCRSKPLSASKEVLRIWSLPVYVCDSVTRCDLTTCSSIEIALVQRLKYNLCDVPPSNFAFKFNLRRCIKEPSMCAKRLGSEAMTRMSGDNITVVVAFLKNVATAEVVTWERAF